MTNGTGNSVKILFATDGGEPAMAALLLLERIAAPERAQITAVTVGTPPSSPSDEGTATSEEILGSAVEKLRGAGFTTDQRLLDGRPADAILEEISEGEYELTVLGAGNRSRLGRLLMGSVSTKILHASPSSVMIVQQVADLDNRPVRVLLGTDGSKHAEMAVGLLIGFADPSSSEIDVVTVAEHLMPVVSFPVPRVAHATSGPTPELEQEWLEVAKQVANSATTKLEAAGFKSAARARLGAPAAQLLEEMDDTEAELIVVGSVGLGAVERAVLGSVSDQIVRQAPAALIARG